MNNILSLTLTVSDIAVKDSGECSTRDVTHIVLTVNEEPTGGIEYLLLRKGENDYKFEKNNNLYMPCFLSKPQAFL